MCGKSRTLGKTEVILESVSWKRLMCIGVAELLQRNSHCRWSTHKDATCLTDCLRLVSQHLPSAGLVENVLGFEYSSSQERAGLTVLVEKLQLLNYSVETFHLDLAEVVEFSRPRQRKHADLFSLLSSSPSCFCGLVRTTRRRSGTQWHRLSGMRLLCCGLPYADCFHQTRDSMS